MSRSSGTLAGFRKTYQAPPSKARYEELRAAERRTRRAQIEESEAVEEVKDSLYNELTSIGMRGLLTWTAIWILLFAGAIYVQFGAVFFVISAFFLIWRFGLRERKANETSAYSVFNPGVSSIQGSQLTGEQLQRSMGIR